MLEQATVLTKCGLFLKYITHHNKHVNGVIRKIVSLFVASRLEIISIFEAK